jgi:hypothetical protein
MSSTSYGIQGNLCLTELPEPEPNQTSSITKLWGGGVVLDFQKADAEKMAMGVRVVPTTDPQVSSISSGYRHFGGIQTTVDSRIIGQLSNQCSIDYCRIG